MRRRRFADLAVAALATLVVAAVVRGAVGVSPSAGPSRTPAALVHRTPTPATSLVATTTPTPALAIRAATVLFVGEAPALRPRGGAAKSFACRAASTLHWQCRLIIRVPGIDAPAIATGPSATLTPGTTPSGGSSRTPATGSAPTSPEVTRSGVTGRPWADYVVVTTAVDDSVPEIRAVLDGLPGWVRGAKVVVLGPITASTSARIVRLITNERALAVEHNATFIDPVAEHWITAATRARYLNRGQLSSAGIVVAAGRLATDLGRLPRPVPEQ